MVERRRTHLQHPASSIIFAGLSTLTNLPPLVLEDLEYRQDPETIQRILPNLHHLRRYEQRLNVLSASLHPLRMLTRTQLDLDGLLDLDDVVQLYTHLSRR